MSQKRLSDALEAVARQMAEVGTHLWTRGWAEANAGNLSADVTELVRPDEVERERCVKLPGTIAQPELAGRCFFITATGARLRMLDVAGAREFEGRGVSQCAWCDGALYKDRHVVVVGGGDAALEEALHLAQPAHRHHHLRHPGGYDLHRQPRPGDRAGGEAQRRLQVTHLLQHGAKARTALSHHHLLDPTSDHVQIGGQHAHPQLEVHPGQRLAQLHASQVGQRPVGTDHRMTGEG